MLTASVVEGVTENREERKDKRKRNNARKEERNSKPRDESVKQQSGVQLDSSALGDPVSIVNGAARYLTHRQTKCCVSATNLVPRFVRTQVTCKRNASYYLEQCTIMAIFKKNLSSLKM
jgi:hypothetical protein